jgi:hypothetical protein
MRCRFYVTGDLLSQNALVYFLSLVNWKMSLADAEARGKRVAVLEAEKNKLAATAKEQKRTIEAQVAELDETREQCDVFVLDSYCGWVSDTKNCATNLIGPPPEECLRTQRTKAVTRHACPGADA